MSWNIDAWSVAQCAGREDGVVALKDSKQEQRMERTVGRPKDGEKSSLIGAQQESQR